MISAPSVLTFGEALVGYATVEDNLRVATRFSRFPGGADLNVAVGCPPAGTLRAELDHDFLHASLKVELSDVVGLARSGQQPSFR